MTELGLLRLRKGVYEEDIDYGGMFPGKAKVVLDEDDDTYAAFVLDGWNGGVGRRYPTLEIAKNDIPRLRKKMFG